jgi:N-carbamoyl-L-amino-acid hydrolase
MQPEAQSIETNYLQEGLNLAERVFGRFKGKQWQTHQEYGGIYCPGYSIQEEEAINILQEEATAMGAKAYVDLAGNTHFYFQGQNRSLAPLMVSSHIDAVPNGGQYDGRAGVVAGLSAIKNIQASGEALPQDIIISVLRAEESAWWDGGVFGVGAKLMTQELSKEFLSKALNVESGQTLEHHMTEIGMDVGALSRAIENEEIIFPHHLIGHNLEPHIEQADALEHEDQTIGVVTDIRTYLRFPSGVSFIGEEAHSGATRQNARKDAGFAASTFATEWGRALKNIISSENVDLVFTMPNIFVVNPANTSVPAKAVAIPESRSNDVEMLERVRDLTLEIAQAAAKEWNCETTFDPKSVNIGSPSVMDQEGCNDLMEMSQALEVKAMTMPSGAGHDAGTLSNHDVPTNMIFWTTGNRGISHNPTEMLARDGENPFSADSSYAAAIKVTTEFLRRGKNVANEQPMDEVFPKYAIKPRQMFVQP